MDDSVGLRGAAPTVRGFWWIFGGGWLAYFGLFFSATVLEGEASGTTIWLGLAVLLPAAVLSVLIAAGRRHLLRPERALGKTVALHAGVGLAYAVSAAAVTVGLLALLGPAAMPPSLEGKTIPPAAWVVNVLFLYLVLAGFLMWTESMARVHESRALAAREAMLRARAEADAIKARFNPHFVFNTLHSLMLLVHAEPEAAERAIEDVASLIRYASILQRRGVDLVPLGQEMEVARRYMALENLRLGERLTVEWGPVDGLATYGVPPLSLQLLLENAVKHGVSTRTEGGTVRVNATREGETLVLTVEDDGEGADPDAVVSSDRRGLGLLEERLVTLFGGAASLTWTTARGKGFRVALRVPRTSPPAVEVPGWESGVVRAPSTGP